MIRVSHVSDLLNQAGGCPGLVLNGDERDLLFLHDSTSLLTDIFDKLRGGPPSRRIAS